MKVPTTATYHVFSGSVAPHALCTGFAVITACWEDPDLGERRLEVGRISGWSLDQEDITAEAQDFAATRPTSKHGEWNSRVYDRGLKLFRDYRTPTLLSNNISPAPLR